MQKQEQAPQDPRPAVIGGTNDNIGQKPVQVVAKGGGENPKELSENSESEWLISIERKLKQAREEHAASSWSELCIYKVPHRLRQDRDKDIVPQTVSLGPYHHGKERLGQMDRHKWRVLRNVLERTNHDITVYLDSVREVEKTARSYYEGPIPLNSNEFVEMMVLDGCFVLEFLIGFCGGSGGFEKLGYLSNDPIFASPGSTYSIGMDMLLLENQLPLFILDRLLKLQLECDCQTDVADLAFKFFKAMDFGGIKTLDRSDAGLHCLEIFQRSLMSRPDVEDKSGEKLAYCATELKDSGIKFKKSEEDRFWDIKFENGVLWIPQIFIGDDAKSLFLNLIAFEQCHCCCSNYLTAYVLFMDELINSPMDVANLRSCGIIEHGLGSDSDVADLFNRLGHGVVFDINHCHLSQVAADVNNFHNRRWNVWKATLKHKYFNNPWAIISLIAAIVLLLLTFMQTFYGVYAYYRPSS